MEESNSGILFIHGKESSQSKLYLVYNYEIAILQSADKRLS
uniref:Uncharacterized protein n=1 Tax=Siphoviridae sp. ctQ0C17 TaxID=2826325 RepID=A0A8S5NBQ1_9CAUD|nr:MAG TPA: hypothetical protein [Siphoviridae sp. ctQ0C17]